MTGIKTTFLLDGIIKSQQVVCNYCVRNANACTLYMKVNY